MNVVRIMKAILRRMALMVCPRNYAYRKYLKAHSRHTSFHGGYDGKDMATYIDESLKVFVPESKLGDKKYVKNLISDIVLCDLRYGTNPTEYFCYGFPEKSSGERLTYLPRKQKDVLLVSQMGSLWEESFNFIKDKNLFYKSMSRFFLRDACPVKEQSDRDEFCRLLNKHGRLIVKPTRGGCGYGVEIISLSDYDGDADAAFERLVSAGEYIAEEIVEQDERIARFNPSSLNTLRIPVFRTERGIRIFYPSIRIGRAGSIVDNAGAGGTFAAIDAQTGVITTDGFDKHGNHYAEHPDSHIRYEGEIIPEWNALKSFVTDIHNSMPPEHKYIAYDMALSKKGWVVVEANWGEISMPQIEMGRGLKQEFITLLNS